MASGDHDGAEQARLAEMIAELADSEHRDIAVAESLTGGIVASRLAAAPRSSRWFRGGVVAYASDVKHELLNVPPGPVVSAQAARAMAEAVRQLLKADVAVALTGAAGPDGQDGQPPGTVFLGLSDETGTHIEHHCFERNDPLEVCAEAVARALRLLYTHLNNGPGSAVAREHHSAPPRVV